MTLTQGRITDESEGSKTIESRSRMTDKIDKRSKTNERQDHGQVRADK